MTWVATTEARLEVSLDNFKPFSMEEAMAMISMSESLANKDS